MVVSRAISILHARCTLFSSLLSSVKLDVRNNLLVMVLLVIEKIHDRGGSYISRG